MKFIEHKIIKWAQNEENVMQALAMLKVGLDKGEPAPEIMKKTLVDALMRFHGIPLKPTE